MTECSAADRPKLSTFSLRRCAAGISIALLVAGGPVRPVAADGNTYSVSLTPITEELAAAVTSAVAASGVPKPSSYQILISSQAFEQLCSGTVERRIYLTHEEIPPGLATKCGKQGIDELISARLGHITLVLVQKVGGAHLNLSSKAIYLALAAQVPVDGGFSPNEAKTWKEVDPSLPDLPIHMVLAPKDFVIRDVFETEAMVAGCWSFPVVKDIYLEKNREEKCRSMRDSAYEEAFSEQERIDALAKAPAGSVALVTMDTYQRNKSNLQLLSFNGLKPTPETLTAEDYTLALPVYLYADATDFGTSEAKTPLASWVAEALSERAIGAGGYLSGNSLSTLPESEREWQRRSLLR